MATAFDWDNQDSDDTTKKKGEKRATVKHVATMDLAFSITPRGGLSKDYDDAVVNGVTVAGYGPIDACPDSSLRDQRFTASCDERPAPPGFTDRDFPAPPVGLRQRIAHLLPDLDAILADFAATCTSWTPIDALVLYVNESERLSDVQQDAFNAFCLHFDELIDLLRESKTIVLRDHGANVFSVNSATQKVDGRALIRDLFASASDHSVTGQREKDDALKAAEMEKLMHDLWIANEELTRAQRDIATLRASNHSIAQRFANEREQLLQELSRSRDERDSNLLAQIEHLQNELQCERRARCTAETMANANADALVELATVKNQLLTLQIEVLHLRMNAIFRDVDDHVVRARAATVKATNMVKILSETEQSRAVRRAVNEWVQVLLNAQMTITQCGEWRDAVQKQCNEQIEQLKSGTREMHDLQPFPEFVATPLTSWPNEEKSENEMTSVEAANHDEETERFTAIANSRRVASVSPSSMIAARTMSPTSGMHASSRGEYPPGMGNDAPSTGPTPEGPAVAPAWSSAASTPSPSASSGSLAAQSREEKLYTHVRKSCPGMRKEEFVVLFKQCKHVSAKLSEISKAICELYNGNR